MKIRTEIRTIAAETRLVSTVEQKISKLKNFFNRIQEAHVLLKSDENELKKSQIAEIKLYIPNGIIFIKESSHTFEAALDKAIVALKCQLVRCKTKSIAYS